MLSFKRLQVNTQPPFLAMLEGAVGVDLKLDFNGHVTIVGSIPDNLTATQQALLQIIRDPLLLVDIDAKESDPTIISDRYEGATGYSGKMTVNVSNLRLLTQSEGIPRRPQGMTAESVAAHIVMEGYLGGMKNVQRLTDDPSIHFQAIDKGENGVRGDQGLSPRNVAGETDSDGEYNGVPATAIRLDFGSHVQFIIVQRNVDSSGRSEATSKILFTQVTPKKR